VSTHATRYPTPWQRKTLWAALSAVCVVLLLLIIGTSIWVLANVISFLQPVLIPVAIAGILAYLLDPVVTLMTTRGLARLWSVIFVFVAAALVAVLLFSWIAPMISVQSANFAHELPNYTQKARDQIVDLAVRYNRYLGVPAGARGKSLSPTRSIVDWLLGSPPPHPTATPAPVPSPSATEPASEATSPPPEPVSPTPVESIGPAPTKLSSADRQRIQTYVEKQIPSIQRYIPTLAEKLWDLVKKSVGGFLGAAGFILSLVLVPIYLFFFLKERPRIEARWKDYLPLRDSPLKHEVAEVITQINHYVIAYFRGQLLVCVVDGCLIGSALTILGLNFAPLIGLLVVILTMIPYIGIIICWIPAVLIAAFQWGDWSHPIWVTIIFVVIQNLEGNFYAPRIIGDSVGLHPLTVIVSIFVWGLLIGGVLGPILAIPLTATIKVLLARYVWAPRVRERVMHEVDDTPVVRKSP
jgi:predicted PurR-regulated permease PerM